MRVALVSHHHTAGSIDPAVHQNLLCLRQCAVALVRHGLQVLWLSSTATAEVLARDAQVIPGSLEDLPATCRYVVPCQPYRLDGVQLVSVDTTLWEQPALHTRLFTFLGLLQQELPWALLHAWGTLSAAYVGVYTARCLGCPAVVTYHQPWPGDDPTQTFLWQWVAEHVAMALVCSHADRQGLLATKAFPPARVQVIDPALPTLGATTAALYQGLMIS